jgi:hypothetical protein
MEVAENFHSNGNDVIHALSVSIRGCVCGDHQFGYCRIAARSVVCSSGSEEVIHPTKGEGTSIIEIHMSQPCLQTSCTAGAWSICVLVEPSL